MKINFVRCGCSVQKLRPLQIVKYIYVKNQCSLEGNIITKPERSNENTNYHGNSQRSETTKHSLIETVFYRYNCIVKNSKSDVSFNGMTKHINYSAPVRNPHNLSRINVILNNSTFKKNMQHVYSKMFYTTHSSGLTHLDDKGTARMVDVGDKLETVRTAKAQAIVIIGKEASELIQKNLIKKGDVLTVAQIAGIMGAKKTSELIPLCHNINLSQVKVDTTLDPEKHSIIITSFVKCKGKTGVEMEALTGVTIATLTIYDMCKAVNKGIIIDNVRLVEKTGGKSDYQFDPKKYTV